MMTIHSAETLFRWLMRAYPKRFRQTHGLALFELFRDEARDAQATRGQAGLVVLLARTTADTIASAPATWLRPVRADDLETPRRLLNGLWQDIRIAARHLQKAPGFTCVAVLMLAAGIGANTTVFGLMNAVVLQPLNSHDPDRIVRIVARSLTGGASGRRFSFREYADYREASVLLDALSAVNLATFGLEADGRSDQLLGEIASGNYLDVLGARAEQGRLLTATDDAAGAPAVAVISDSLWRRRFDSGAVIGRSILLNRLPYTIVGVADAAVIGSFVGVPCDVWVPIETSGQALGTDWRTDRAQRELMMIARLRQGATPRQAQAELQSIADAIARDSTPRLQRVVELEAGTLATGDQRRLARMFLSLLLGLVALVLLIACANVANLLLARVLGRRRELAVRVALGASPGRLARMLVVEALLVSAAGGAAALILSIWTSRVFANLQVLPTLALRLDLRPDARVIGFTAFATLGSALVLGLVGAIHAINPDIAPALKEDSTASIGGRTSSRIRGALAAVQITVSLLLLIGAALLLRSVRGASEIALGFEPAGVVAVDAGAFGGRTNEQSLRIFKDVLQRAATLPQIEAASVSTRAPLDNSTPLVRINARETVAAGGDQASPTVSFLIVSAGYFNVIRTPIVTGRSFSDTDEAGRPPVAIVNETLARRLWPDTDPIGRQLWIDRAAVSAPETACVIVGVAKDSKYLTLGEERQGHLYLPFTQQPRRGMTVLVRSHAPPDRAVADLQELLHAVDPQLQGFFPRTLTDHVAVSLLPVRIAASLTTVVALLALGLAVVGLYSLVSFLVAERTHEIGLRMALGASTSAVRRLVIGYGLRLARIGLAIGVPTAFAASRLLRGLLYGVSPTDPLVFAAVSSGVVLVAVVACYVPARRAMRVDPIRALRNE